MPNLIISPKWNLVINEIAFGELAKGGPDGNINAATKQLAENVFWLKADAEVKQGEIASSVTAEADRSTQKYAEIDAKTSGLQNQLNSVGGGKFAYTTYAEMVAAANLPAGDPLKLPAKSSIDVINNIADPTKNGTYGYDGSVFTDSLYDPLTQAKIYADSNALFKPELIASPTNLNTKKKSGLYLTTTVSYITLELNYPVVGSSGVLLVNESAGTSLIVQTYTTAKSDIFTRFYNGTIWSAWADVVSQDKVVSYLQNYPTKSEVLSYGATMLNTDNLNDIKTSSIRVASTKHNNWLELNYPIRDIGVLETFKTPASSLVFQKFTQHRSVYTRFFAGTWSAWLEITVTEAVSDSYAVKGVISTQDLDSLKVLGVYLKNSSSTGTAELNYPTKDIGVLKVYKGSMSSLVIQEFVSIKGSVYIRFFNSIEWSSWIANNPSIASSGGSDSLTYKKAATGLDFYSKSANGNNSIKIGLLRKTNPLIQQDVWGVSGCYEVNGEGTIVKPITSTGVWETAIAAAENAGDHSGGGHGDEILQSAYFMVDGVYYPQDFVGEGAAKEIKFYQKSTIYIEAKTDVLCYKEIVWTFNSKGLNLKQKLTFPTAKVLNTSWIAMLPVLRKTNQNNTGDRVTDTEIRSQDGIVIDVSEPLFPMRNLGVKDGDSISLSSSVSGIGAELIMNTITASDNPQCFVQNTDPYNKIYIQGSAIGVPYTTAINEEWYIDADFKVTTSN